MEFPERFTRRPLVGQPEGRVQKNRLRKLLGMEPAAKETAPTMLKRGRLKVIRMHRDKLTSQEVKWIRTTVEDYAKRDDKKQNPWELLKDLLTNRQYHHYQDENRKPLLEIVEKYFNHLKAAGAKA